MLEVPPCTGQSTFEGAPPHRLTPTKQARSGDSREVPSVICSTSRHQSGKPRQCKGHKLATRQRAVPPAAASDDDELAPAHLIRRRRGQPAGRKGRLPQEPACEFVVRVKLSIEYRRADQQ